MAGIGNFARYRIAFSRLVALGLLAALLFSDLPVWQDPLLTRILYWIGFVLMMVCALGRLWSLQYLSGYKTRTIVESGPFSVVRNPLYLFSFLGALGAALVANHLLLLLVLVLAYIAYYPFVVVSEERGLERELGEAYMSYKARVPRFLPKFSLYHNPDEYTIRSRKFTQAYLDAIWFPMAFMLLTLLLELKASGVLPLGS